MASFIKGIFTDKDGSPSSKRIVMFILTILFVFVSVVNLYTGKSLSDTLENQLFYLLCWIFSIVFGENITAIFKDGKTSLTNKKDDSNIEQK